MKIFAKIWLFCCIISPCCVAKQFNYSFAIHFEYGKKESISLPIYDGTITFTARDIYEAQRAAVAYAADIRDSIQDILTIFRNGLQLNSSIRTPDIIAKQLSLIVRFQPLVHILIKHKIPQVVSKEIDKRALKAIASLSNPQKYSVEQLQQQIESLQPIHWNIVLKHSMSETL